MKAAIVHSFDQPLSLEGVPTDSTGSARVAAPV